MEPTMELKSYADILALHTTLADTFRKRVDKLKEELPKSNDGLLAGKRAALKTAKEAAANVERARKEANRRFDADLARRSGEAEKLVREIDALEKSAKSGKPAKAEDKEARPAVKSRASKALKTTKPK
jgi:hypothetical protein